MGTDHFRFSAYVKRTTSTILPVFLLILLTRPLPGVAQPGEDEEYENLQILPEDISEEELRGIMFSFSAAMGVRCTHCHVRVDGQPPQMDFASDEKPTKETARAMMRMVQAINGEHLTGLPTVEGEALQVSCVTCHHGLTKPQLLEDQLADFLPAHGLDSTFALYDSLREEYYGGFSYDFTDGPLVRLAERLISEQKATEALAFLERNQELYPNSSQTFTTMADAYLELGDPAAAIASLEKAVALEPNNNRLRERLDELKSQ